jgi:hypothetical protein
VYGDLPKDSGGTSRLWSVEAVRRLEAARALLSAGQARSIKDALRAVEGGAAPPVEVMAHDGRVEAALGVVAARLEAVLDSNRRLEAEVAALRSEVAGLRALPADVNPERIDRALEVEMMEGRVEAERPAGVEDRQAGVEVVNGVEPQKLEQESWMAAIALKALATASKLPAAPREGRGGGESPDEAPGEAEGPMVRAVRWLERRLYGGKGN